MRTLPALVAVACLAVVPMHAEALDLSKFGFSQKVQDALANVQARIDEARSRVQNLPSYTIPSYTVPSFTLPTVHVPNVHVPIFPIHGIGLPLDACEIADATQARFETQFSDLQMDYDDGLANISDFFESPEYTAVVSGVEHLISKHDIFLDGVQLSIDALGRPAAALENSIDRITSVEDRILTNPHLPESAVGHITSAFGKVQSQLGSIRDKFLEPQMELANKLPGYEAFNTEMQDYLQSIIDAASEDGTGEMMAAVEAASGVTLTSGALLSAPLLAASQAPGAMLANTAAGSAVPEPAAWVLLLGVAAAAGTLRRKR